MERIDRALFIVLAVFGLLVTVVAVRFWVPDSVIELPERNEVLEWAMVDAEGIGYRVEGQPSLQVSAGPRLYTPVKPLEALVRDEPTIEGRRRRLHEAVPVRLAARFSLAVGPNGTTGDLVLEYDDSGRLAGASFGVDGLVVRGLPPPGGAYFADDLAERLLRDVPPAREETGLGGLHEFVYRPAAGGASVYVYLGPNGAWTAQRQSASDLLVSRQARALWDRSLAEQVELYAAAGAVLLLLAVLLWRLAQRRAGFSQSALPGLILGVGLLPVIGNIEVQTSVLIALVVLFLLPNLGVLLVWIVGEAEVREARPGSVEHWDRLVRRRPVKATGRAILTGFGFGCILSGVVSASGRIAALFGGGYGSYLLTVPDYWLLPTSLNRGMAVAAGTAFLVGLGGRVAGRMGAVVGAALAGLGWSVLVPVSPIGPAWLLGIAASLAAGWAVWHHGLLPLTVACVTGMSLPVAWIAWSYYPLMLPVALVSSLPLLLLPLALWMLEWAPEHDLTAEIEPAYVASLDQQARLEGEVELLRKLQLSLLPGREAVGVDNGFDAAWKMVPAEAVGGDFLDLIEDEAGRLWIAVADVAGHGISCSVLTAFTKAAVTEHATADATPAAALDGIRRLFGRLRVPRAMVTLLLAVWDSKTGRLSVSNAGHPPILLCHEREVREVGLGSRPLGVELPGEDLEETIECRDGTVLVAYTDGVCEASSPSGEVFGYDRWRYMLPLVGRGSADSILVELLAAVEDHRAGHAPRDDTTAVVVRFGSRSARTIGSVDGS